MQDRKERKLHAVKMPHETVFKRFLFPQPSEKQTYSTCIARTLAVLNVLCPWEATSGGILNRGWRGAWWFPLLVIHGLNWREGCKEILQSHTFLLSQMFYFQTSLPCGNAGDAGHGQQLPSAIWITNGFYLVFFCVWFFFCVSSFNLGGTSEDL